MKKWLALLLLLALLSGCAASTADSGSANAMTVYRLYDGSDAGELVQPESCLLESGERADLDTALRLFVEKPRHSHLRAAVSGDVTLLGSTAQNGLVTLNFSESFLSLSPMEQSLAAFCAALTLCRLDDVDAVSIAAGGTTIFQGLDTEDALLQDTDSDPYTRRLHLYFADETDTWLVSEYHSLSLSDDTPLERYVMEELLRGPNDPALHSAIPAGTELLSCRTENGVCTVDLSAAFVENRPQTALGERLTVWAIVNSLTVLSDVDSVQLLCEGQRIETYVYRSLAEPLTAFKPAIGPASAPKGETQLRLGIPMPNLAQTALLPYACDVSAYGSLTEAAVATLYEAQEPACPALFTGSLPTVSIANGSCAVEVTESFFAALSPAQRSAAVQALTATVLQAGEARRVYFTIGGEAAVFEETSYFGPYTTRDINYAE